MTGVRPATIDDAETISRLVHEHAAYENEADACTTDADDIRREAFGPEPSIDILIAERDGVAVGLAIFCEVYASWDGRSIMLLEDLYLRDDARGSGLGRALLARVAAAARERGCRRVEWVVESGNPARDFYEHLGGVHIAARQTYRVSGAALDSLAEDGAG